MWKRRQSSQDRLKLAVRAMASTLLACAMVMTSTIAGAQERPRTLLDMIFGTPRQTYVEPPPPRSPRQPANVRPQAPRAKPSTSRGSVTTITTAPPKPAPPAKLEDARKILVVGDFFANALADGLTEAFSDAPGVQIIEKSNGSSGLVREDYYDWPNELPKLIAEVKPAMVVVQIGANDRQQLATPSASHDFRTPSWYQEYERRIGALARISTEQDIPLLWVGLPAFRSPTMTSDAITLNGIYRSTVTAAGGEFIDIWEGFVDIDGRFLVTGSDINGQQVRLRGADGIGLTAPGKRKVAFYVEKSARRLLGEMAVPGVLNLEDGSLPDLVSLPPSENQLIVRTRPIDFSDPDLDGGAELLDRDRLAISPVPTPRDNLIEKGELPPAPFGRVDDFSVLRTGSTEPQPAPVQGPAPAPATQAAPDQKPSPPEN